jgi:hypothetical protein
LVLFFIFLILAAFTSNTPMNLAKGQGLQGIKGQKVPGQNQEDNEKRN